MNFIERVVSLCLCGFLCVSVVNGSPQIIHHRGTEFAQRHREGSVQPDSTTALDWKFDFGPGALAPGYKRVMPQDIYNRETGFGFEPGPQIVCMNRDSKDPLRA